ncbi:hypothetical protein MKEN_00146900 [Mycena kentingensis (nom. inval.)]|nr:hypothetical protein MKEN_00146900 [Mycena kentingensis (nom. inval.)]
MSSDPPRPKRSRSTYYMNKLYGQPIWLGRSFARSISMNPRHLEVQEYGHWIAKLQSFAPVGKSLIRNIHPQHGIWSSEPDTTRNTNNLLNISAISNNTTPDGAARGCYVDIAAVIPLPAPRKKLPRRSRGLCPPSDFVGKTVQWFFDSVLAVRSYIEPSFLRIIGLLAPLLVELKLGAPRNAPDMETYHGKLSSLLSSAQTQGLKQALALFGSWRFRYQGSVILIAGAGDDFTVCRVTRGWGRRRRLKAPEEREEEGAEKEEVLPSAAASAAQAKLNEYDARPPVDIDENMKEIDDYVDQLEDYSESEVDSDDSDEELHPTGLTKARYKEVQPLRTDALAKYRVAKRARKDRIQFAAQLHEYGGRAQRTRNVVMADGGQERLEALEQAEQDAAEEFESAAQALARALPPVRHDTLRAFPAADMDIYHRSLDLDADDPFYEKRTAEEFFKGNGDTPWSRVLHVGSKEADDFFRYIERDIRRCEAKERERRRGLVFPSYGEDGSVPDDNNNDENDTGDETDDETDDEGDSEGEESVKGKGKAKAKAPSRKRKTRSD